MIASVCASQALIRKVSVRLASRLFALVVLLSVICLPRAYAQMDAGSLRVLVLDRGEAVVVSASVKLLNTNTGVEQTAASDSQGYVNFTPISRGTYSLITAQGGFRSREIRDITIDVNQHRFIRVVLENASVNESVEVTTTGSALQTEEGSVGHVISGKVAVELPLAGRRYTELATLVPGATPSTMTLDTRGPGWFLVNGNSQTQNNFMLDGFDNNQGTQNAQALSSQVVQPNPDAIEQFKVQTNSFSAEFGRSAGAVVNVSIKSGTNQNHGSAWYYNRDASLAATSWNAKTFATPKDDLGWNQFGGTFGGPIFKNKLFYFGSYEGFLRSFSASGVGPVPTPAEHTGQFAVTITDPRTGRPFQNNFIPRERWDPLAAKIIDIYQPQNRTGRVAANGLVTDNYAYRAPGTENTQKFDTRGDFIPNANNRFFVRYSFLRQRIWRDQIFEGIAEANGNQGEQFNLNHSMGLSYNHIFNSKIVNEARFGYNNTDARFAHATANAQRADQFGFSGYPPDQLTTGGLPLINLTNYTSVGVRNFRPQFQRPNSYQILDTVSMLFGRHSLRAGFEARIKQDFLNDTSRVLPSYSFTGTFTGNALADFLLGYVNSFSASTRPFVDLRQQAYAGFLQDDFKASRVLTFNIGLRYEYATPNYGKGQYPNINFNPATGNLVNTSSDDKYTVDPDRNNFAPRLGVAYQAIPEHLVLRAGYGLFYSAEEMNGSEGLLPINPPSVINATLQSTGSGSSATPAMRLSDPFPAGILSSYTPSQVSLTARNRDQQSALIQQWNMTTQLLLPWKTSLEVAYVGNRGGSLQVNLPINATQFGVDGSVAANRPYSQWRQISMWFSAAHSKYDSMQVKFERRMSGGLYLLTSYTLAKAYEEAGGWGAGGHAFQGTLRPDFSNLDTLLRAESGRNSQTARHRLTFTEVWEIPFGRGRRFGARIPLALDAVIGGWQVSGITSWRTGLPVDITMTRTGTDPATGRAYSFFDRNGGSFRPNATGIDPNRNSDAKADRLHYLDPAAFSVPTVNTPGNFSPAGAWGPGRITTDMSFVKRFTFEQVPLLSRMTTDVRAEAFNLFNHVNYDNPNGSYPSSSFGSITSASDPRIVQLALRIGW